MIPSMLRKHFLFYTKMLQKQNSRAGFLIKFRKHWFLN